MPMPDTHSSVCDFVHLPDELHVRILLELDIDDLVTCYKICRVLRNAMEDSLQLRYRMALARAGLEDGPSPGRSLIERAQILAKYGPNRSESIPCYRFDKQCYFVFRDVIGGALVYVVDYSVLEVHEPACILTDVAEKTWRINLAHSVGSWERILRIAISIDKDLLALTTRIEGIHKCYFISLSHGGLYPSAAHNPLIPAAARTSPLQNTIEIVGDLIGWSFDGVQGAHMHVYNWITGQLLWYDKPTTEVRMYKMVHILKSSHAIKIVHTGISVSTLASGAPGPTSGTLAKDVCCLQLPPLAEGLLVDHVRSYCQRPPLHREASFNYDPDLTVLVLYLHVNGPFRHSTVIIVIPLWTILKTIERISRSASPPTTSASPLLVPWDAWGADGARIILLPSVDRYSPDIVSVSGSRVALTFSKRRIPGLRQGEHCEVIIFDVHRRLEDSDHGRSSAGQVFGPSDTAWVSDFYLGADTTIFRDPVHTRMPYRAWRGKFSPRELLRTDAGIDVRLIHDGIVNVWGPES